MLLLSVDLSYNLCLGAPRVHRLPQRLDWTLIPAPLGSLNLLLTPLSTLSPIYFIHRFN
jgi:hypothetical protein